MLRSSVKIKKVLKSTNWKSYDEHCIQNHGLTNCTCPILNPGEHWTLLAWSYLVSADLLLVLHSLNHNLNKLSKSISPFTIWILGKVQTEFFELVSKNFFFSSTCSIKVKYFKSSNLIFSVLKRSLRLIPVAVARKTFSWIPLPLILCWKTRSYYNALVRTCSRRKFKGKFHLCNSIEFIFYWPWEASVSSG